MKLTIKELVENKDNKYMFHGSSNKHDVLIPHLANDANGNKSNIDNAVFLSSDFLGSVPYAFKDKIIEKSKGLNWSFSISTDKSKTKMVMQNVRIDENIEGFVHVFLKTDDMLNDPKGSTQWKSYKELKPVEVLKVKYKDFEKYFEVKDERNEERIKGCI